MSQAKTYFSDGAVTITAGKMTVHATTYPLEKILSYTVLKMLDDKFWWSQFFLWTGGIAVLCGIAVFFLLGSINWTTNILMFAVLGCVMVGAIIAALLNPRKEFIKNFALSLQTASGNESVIYSKNPAYIQSIADALGNALDRT